jgi:hypothetical protein
MSRQYDYQKRKQANGQCVTCGNPAPVSTRKGRTFKRRCDKCAAKLNALGAKYRLKRGIQPRRKQMSNTTPDRDGEEPKDEIVIKDCPFCGSRAYVGEAAWYIPVRCLSKRCPASKIWFLLAEWNTRAPESRAAEPVPMILHCPECHFQHVDKATPDVCEKCGHDEEDHPNDDECQGFVAWLNPPHRKHRCHRCGHLWRPALIATTGVAELPEEK